VFASSNNDRGLLLPATLVMRLHNTFQLLLCPARGAKYCDQHVCLSVSPLAFLKNDTSRLCQTVNESQPKITINDAVIFFLNCNQHFDNFKP